MYSFFVMCVNTCLPFDITYIICTRYFFFQCFENQMQMLFTDHQTILEMTMYKVCTKSLHSKTHPNKNCWWRHDVRLVVSHDCTLLVTCALCMATVWSSWSRVTCSACSGQSLTSHRSRVDGYRVVVVVTCVVSRLPVTGGICDLTPTC